MFSKKTSKFTAREQAKRISKGIDEPHHIGIKSNPVLQQEFFALLNLAINRRDKKWHESWNDCKKDCLKRGLYYSLCSKYGYLNHKIPQ